jgi:hypothetical protein
MARDFESCIRLLRKNGEVNISIVYTKQTIPKFAALWHKTSQIGVLFAEDGTAQIHSIHHSTAGYATPTVP